MYGDLRITAGLDALRLTWGSYQDVALEHWHHDTFVAPVSGLAGDRLFVTFGLNARAEVVDVDLERLEDFERRPEEEKN